MTVFSLRLPALKRVYRRMKGSNVITYQTIELQEIHEQISPMENEEQTH